MTTNNQEQAKELFEYLREYFESHPLVVQVNEDKLRAIVRQEVAAATQVNPEEMQNIVHDGLRKLRFKDAQEREFKLNQIVTDEEKLKMRGEL